MKIVNKVCDEIREFYPNLYDRLSEVRVRQIVTGLCETSEEQNMEHRLSRVSDSENQKEA